MPLVPALKRRTIGAAGVIFLLVGCNLNPVSPTTPNVPTTISGTPVPGGTSALTPLGTPSYLPAPSIQRSQAPSGTASTTPTGGSSPGSTAASPTPTPGGTVHNLGVDVTDFVTATGTSATPGFVDYFGNPVAPMAGPQAIAIVQDGYFIADTSKNRILKLIPNLVNGKLTNFTVIPIGTGQAGNLDGDETHAQFNAPQAIVADSAGNLFVADTGNNCIRECSVTLNAQNQENFTVKTFAGSTTAGYNNDVGAAAAFNKPTGLTVDAGSNLYVADSGNNCIRKITPAQVVTTLAGTPSNVGLVDGTGAAAAFNAPGSVAVDTKSNVFVSDTGNNCVRRVTPSGVVQTLAGTGTAGAADGPGNLATFNKPLGLTLDSSGDIYVADSGNHMLRHIAGKDGTTTTFAGNGQAGHVTGPGALAEFNNPTWITFDSSGNYFIADSANNEIYQIALIDVVSTIAGATTPAGQPATAGESDGTGIAASFTNPWAMAVGQPGTLYVAEMGGTTNGGLIRQLTLSDPLTGLYTAKTIAGVATGAGGFQDGAATSALFNHPRGIAYDANAKAIYLADTGNNRIRKLTYATDPTSGATSWTVSTYAGSGTAGLQDGAGKDAQFNQPRAVAVDSRGNVFVADAGNQRIREITFSSGQPQVSTIAGADGAGFADGAGLQAHFSWPSGICVDAQENVYVVDNGTGRVRRLQFATAAGGSSGWVVQTIAGSGQPGYSDGAGIAASFNSPWGITVDGSGNLFVADYGNSAIRKIDPSFNVTTYAGVNSNNSPVQPASGYADGSAISAQFRAPTGVAADSLGYVFVADMINNRIRQIQ